MSKTAPMIVGISEVENELPLYKVENQTHIALVKGDLAVTENPYVRVHIADPIRDLIFGWHHTGSRH